MPLLKIVGSTCLNKSFYVAFAFLSREEEGDYTWALEQLRILFPSTTQPRVMVTDREIALMNSIRAVFPGT
jgi:hypothetical protein